MRLNYTRGSFSFNKVDLESDLRIIGSRSLNRCKKDGVKFLNLCFRLNNLNEFVDSLLLLDRLIFQKT